MLKMKLQSSVSPVCLSVCLSALMSAGVSVCLFVSFSSLAHFFSQCSYLFDIYIIMPPSPPTYLSTLNYLSPSISVCESTSPVESLCFAHVSAYQPLKFNNSSCVPCSAILPSFITIIISE